MNGALRYDQPVLTPFGWRQADALREGDAVTGADGVPCTVTGVHPRGVVEMFEVVISDGTVVVVGADHLWTTTTTGDRNRHRAATVRTTGALAATVRLPSGRVNHYLPAVSGPVEMPDATLPLDPYTLGVLLGDGGLSHGSVMLSNPEPEIVEAVRAAMPAGVHLVQVTDIDYRLSAGMNTVPGRRGLVNPLMDILRELGVWGCRSYDKAIPERYMLGSAEQRLALMQGLFDTDGSAATTSVEYSSASKQLASDVAWLAQSLGGVARTAERHPWFTYRGERREGHISYRMRISLPGDIAPFRLVRKRAALRPLTRFAPYRQVVEVRPVPAAEAVGIAVDARDALFLTSGCVPTHGCPRVTVRALQEVRS